MNILVFIAFFESIIISIKFRRTSSTNNGLTMFITLKLELKSKLVNGFKFTLKMQFSAAYFTHKANGKLFSDISNIVEISIFIILKRDIIGSYHVLNINTRMVLRFTKKYVLSMEPFSVRNSHFQKAKLIPQTRHIFK